MRRTWRDAPVNFVVPELDVDEYTAARRMIATTFADEPFAFGMFGESPVDRFEGMIGEYASCPDAVDPVVVAAELAGVVVGVRYATLPGNCGLCDRFDETNEPGHSPHPIEIEFQSACRQSETKQDQCGNIAETLTPYVQPFGLHKRVWGMSTSWILEMWRGCSSAAH